jgi:AGZA family xanthine/uracil permease-like MFS transporter
MGIVAANPATFVTIGDVTDPNVLLGIAGTFIVFALVVWKVKGAFIISILVTAVLGYITGIAKVPSSFFSLPADISPIFMQLDLSWLKSWKLAAPLIAPVITFMLTDLFDSLGTLAGVGFRAGVFDKDDSVPVQKTLEVDALATVAGSMMGLSTTTSFIESAAGVEEGGRTGLTAVVTGLCFTFTLFLLPFFTSIPANAIFPVLVVVGIFMFAELHKIDFTNYEFGIPAFLIVVLMPLTFSITKGLAAGFIAYTFIKLVKGKYRELNVILIIMTLVSIIAFIPFGSAKESGPAPEQKQECPAGTECQVPVPAEIPAGK